MSNMSKLRTSAAIASLLAFAPFSVMAGTPSVRVNLTATPSTALKHLPAGHDEMTFRGETAHRRWPI